MHAVRTDDDPRTFLGRLAPGLRRPDSRYGARSIANEILQGDTLTDVHAGFDGGVEEDLIEDDPSRCIGVPHSIGRGSRTGQSERTEVESHVLDQRCAGLEHAIEQVPPLQRGKARLVDPMSGHRVARERCPIDHQHSIAQAGKQHRRR
jgi:hypothetical protein